MISACMWVVLIPATILVRPPTDACQIAMLWYLSSISFSSILHFLRKFLSTYFPCYLTFAAHMLWLVWHHSVVDNYFPLRDLLWPPSATQSVDSSLLQSILHSDSLSHQYNKTSLQLFLEQHHILNSEQWVSTLYFFLLFAHSVGQRGIWVSKTLFSIVSSTQQTYAWQHECFWQLFLDSRKILHHDEGLRLLFVNLLLLLPLPGI